MKMLWEQICSWAKILTEKRRSILQNKPQISAVFPLKTLCLHFPEERILHISTLHPRQIGPDDLLLLTLDAVGISQRFLYASPVLLLFFLQKVFLLRTWMCPFYDSCLDVLCHSLCFSATAPPSQLYFFCLLVLLFQLSLRLGLFHSSLNVKSTRWICHSEAFLLSACALTLTFSHLDRTIVHLWVVFSFSSN